MRLRQFLREAYNRIVLEYLDRKAVQWLHDNIQTINDKTGKEDPEDWSDRDIKKYLYPNLWSRFKDAFAHRLAQHEMEGIWEDEVEYAHNLPNLYDYMERKGLEVWDEY